ncbi:YhgE/Pip domain-containing protein [Paenibacillus wynnii]|uniref:YhgE/Pip domain-containing protein n=1 Tax=Paenibacillus wynnii TaxID=268407 RepID=UPI002790F9E7|nr:ABC transporter permease [Paenibacillus wynnii]MDQ0193522.1 YhgE/Pip-like protein [Paenibacillus wynnii]
MALIKQKKLWIGIVAVFVVLVVFGAAMMGSIVGAKPKNLPVAIVVLDQQVGLPTGESLAVGEKIREKLLSNNQAPIVWKVVGSESEVRAGLDHREYYGALVLPADLSSGMLSLASPDPKPATVKIITNEGANTQASSAVKQMLGAAMKGVSLELSTQLLGLMSQQSEQITVGAAKALLSPIIIEEETVHAVGINNASGNAPGMLTQIQWIGSLVAGLMLFIISKEVAAKGTRRWVVILSQIGVGLVLIMAVSGFLVWMASSWYGMELTHAVDTWLFLWLAGSAFFLIQSSLLNWIGLPAMGILVLLMFFSMPVLNIAPEFLTQATQDWLYSWVPLKFVAVGLREVMYFGGFKTGSMNVEVLWGISVFFLIVLVASGVKKGRTQDVATAATTVNPVS